LTEIKPGFIQVITNPPSFMRKCVFIFIILLTACSGRNEPAMTEKYKAEIIQTELEFCKMAADKGIAAAFYEYADTGAVIDRGELIKGKDAIKAYYESGFAPGTKLEWAPDFADVSGTIGYTYGKFTFSATDSTGNTKELKGYFHTVWKRQPDGTWRFVWD